MLPEDYARVRGLYDQVIDLQTDTRLARLRELSADANTISEVLALISAAEVKTYAHLSKPLKGMLNSVNAPKLKPGDTLGVWRIEREIGQGGMGSVFLVERQDGHFTQTAALKFVKGLPRADTLNYFTRERQLLATLTHPNIARLLDGGASAEGQPYLVMEYINGVAIDEYCKQHKLTTPQILKLFTAACDAVAFAHRQLIVHCDLKPSNLLVNLEGRPVLLDFGIARLVDRVGTAGAQGDEPTATAYTPRYASPEQREQGIVSTVSDIYSLGVLLGELLDTNAKQNVELNAILRKATASGHEKRYATVDAFTDDIARFVQKLPVYAMPHMPTYVAKKFLQRRWPLVLAGLAFAVTVAGFTMKVVIESQRAGAAEQTALNARDRAQLAESQAVKERDATQLARAEALRERDNTARERDGAARERDRAQAAERVAIDEKQRATQAESAARQTSDFMVSVFENVNATGEGSDIPASKLLAIAEARLEKEMQGQPLVQSELYYTLGVVQKNMVAFEKSVALHERAITMERKHNRPLVLAQMLFQLSNSHHLQGNYRAALPPAKESLAMTEKAKPLNQEGLGKSLSQVGLTLLLMGNRSEAAPYLQRGLAALEKLDPNAENTAYAYLNWAAYLGRNREHVAAQAATKRTIAIRTALYGEQHERTLRARENLSLHLRRNGEWAESEAILRDIIAIRTAQLGRDHLRVAIGYESLGTHLQTQERFADARAAFREAVVIIDKADRDSLRHAAMLRNLASAEDSLGDNQAAIATLKTSLPQLRKLGEAGKTNLANHLRYVGLLMTRETQFEAAEPMLKEALALSEEVSGAKSAEVGYSLLYLFNLAVSSGKLDQADVYHTKLKPLLPMRELGPQSIYLRVAARLEEVRGNLDEALRGYEAAEAMRAQVFGENSLSANREKMSRVLLLRRRNRPGDHAASVALAKQIHNAIANKQLPNSPLLVQLQQLMRE
jgi:eukaryotic-like serine/threonine-protein kinase